MEFIKNLSDRLSSYLLAAGIALETLTDGLLTQMAVAIGAGEELLAGAAVAVAGTAHGIAQKYKA